MADWISFWTTAIWLSLSPADGLDWAWKGDLWRQDCILGLSWIETCQWMTEWSYYIRTQQKGGVRPSHRVDGCRIFVGILWSSDLCTPAVHLSVGGMQLTTLVWLPTPHIRISGRGCWIRGLDLIQSAEGGCVVSRCWQWIVMLYWLCLILVPWWQWDEPLWAIYRPQLWWCRFPDGSLVV